MQFWLEKLDDRSVEKYLSVTISVWKCIGIIAIERRLRAPKLSYSMDFSTCVVTENAVSRDAWHVLSMVLLKLNSASCISRLKGIRDRKEKFLSFSVNAKVKKNFDQSSASRIISFEQSYVWFIAYYVLVFLRYSERTVKHKYFKKDVSSSLGRICHCLSDKLVEKKLSSLIGGKEG